MWKLEGRERGLKESKTPKCEGRQKEGNHTVRQKSTQGNNGRGSEEGVIIQTAEQGELLWGTLVSVFVLSLMAQVFSYQVLAWGPFHTSLRGSLPSAKSKNTLLPSSKTYLPDTITTNAIR